MGSLLSFPHRRRGPGGRELARWRVPFRNVFCDSFSSWWRQTLWCHVVIRVFPHVHDFGSDALTELYITDPFELHAQLQFLLYEVRDLRRRREPPRPTRPPEPRTA